MASKHARLLAIEVMTKEELDEPMTVKEYNTLMSEINEILDAGGKCSITDKLVEGIEQDMSDKNLCGDVIIVSHTGTILVY